MLGLGFQGGFLCNSSMTLLSRVSAVRSPVYVTLKRQQLSEPPLWSFIAALPARSGQLQVHPPAGTFGNACCSSAYSALSAPC